MRLFPNNTTGITLFKAIFTKIFPKLFKTIFIGIIFHRQKDISAFGIYYKKMFMLGRINVFFTIDIVVFLTEIFYMPHLFVAFSADYPIPHYRT